MVSLHDSCGAEGAKQLALKALEPAGIVELLGTPQEQQACSGREKAQVGNEIRLTVYPEPRRIWIYRPKDPR